MAIMMSRAEADAIVTRDFLPGDHAWIPNHIANEAWATHLMWLDLDMEYEIIREYRPDAYDYGVRVHASSPRQPLERWDWEVSL